MKIKTLILGLGLFPFSVLASEQHWYVGFGIGGQDIDTYSDGTQIINTSSSYNGNDNEHLAQLSFSAQVAVGYKYVCPNTFVLTEVFYTPTKMRANGTELFGWDGDPTEYFYTRLSKDESGGIAGKLGRFISDDWGAYATLGLLYADFKIKNSFVEPLPGPTVVASKNRSRFGLAPGVGLIYGVSGRLPFRFEYTYELYQKVTSHQIDVLSTTDGTGEVLSYEKVKPRYQTFIVSMAYVLF